MIPKNYIIKHGFLSFSPTLHLPDQIVNVNSLVDIDIKNFKGLAVISQEVSNWCKVNVVFGEVNDKYEIGYYEVQAASNFHAYYDGEKWHGGSLGGNYKFYYNGQ